MIFKAEKIGAVDKCEIDLSKKLIIFTGPNNTGKTYIAHAIYGLFKKQYRVIFPHKLRSKILSIIPINEGRFDLLGLLLNKEYHYEIAKAYTETLPLVFASTKDNFKDSLITISETEDYIIKNVLDREVNTTLNFQNSKIHITKAKGSTFLEFLLVESTDEKEIKANKKEEIFDKFPTRIILDVINEIAMDIVLPNIFIAPAERMAINIFNKELSVQRNVLLDKLLELGAAGNNKIDDPFDIINRRATRYPMPIRDSLEIADDISNFKKKSSQFSFLADELEKSILDGRIEITRDGDVEYRPNKNKSQRLSMHLTASMVKSLSNLVIYFRHLAKKGDYIIIDEPEINLHPDNQILLTRWIGKVIKNGFKVIITTHSDYILNEFNVHILLSKYKDRKKLPFGYTNENIIMPDEVGVYLFKYDNTKSRKSKVQKLNVTEEGFEIETIDEVINSLNKKIQTLHFETLEDEDE